MAFWTDTKSSKQARLPVGLLIGALLASSGLGACQSSRTLEAPTSQAQNNALVTTPSIQPDQFDQDAQTDQGSLVEPAYPQTSKTHLINGLLSGVPFIGYGFRNLKKKMPEARLHFMTSGAEGPAITASILKEAEAAHRRNPNYSVNLIGISLGANLITQIAAKLDKKNITVNYLGIVDGTSLVPITDNVKKADNLTCSYLDCTRAKARLARGNNTTILTRKVYQSSHIPLGNHDGLHAHVIAQSRQFH